MKKTFKKIVAAVVVMGTFTAYVVSQRNGAQNNPTLAQNSSGQNSVPSETINLNQNPTPAPAPTPTPKPVPKGAFTDGTYTGTVADAYYGPVQVQAVVTNGKLSDVVFLQYPQDRSTSLRKSQMAMPILKSEAISAQSAQVNTVSGATQTSLGFITSMQSALSQAKA